MSEIRFTCSKCGVEIEAAESFAGSVAQCPSCNSTVMIPMPGIRPGMKIAGYEVVRRLGAGGMGEVWLANQTAMDRKIALKILSPALTSSSEFIDRFLKEVKNTAKLEHPNIITAHDAGVDNGIYYLAMSYVDGAVLEDLLSIDKKVPEKEALRIVRCVADALRYAWDEFKILHRDIKPANIMLDSRKNPKLMDMGISKSMSEEKGLTMTGMIIGTPYYMSPEQARAEADMDSRSDIYSLGSTLYHLVTGEVPYDATTAMGILMKHMADPFPPPQKKNPLISDECSTLLEIMMAKSPNDRQKTWEDVISDIDLVISGKFPASVRPSAGKSTVMQETPSQKISRKKILEEIHKPVNAPEKAALASSHSPLRIKKEPNWSPSPREEKEETFSPPPPQIKKEKSRSSSPFLIIFIGGILCAVIVFGIFVFFSEKKAPIPAVPGVAISDVKQNGGTVPTPSNNGPGGTGPSNKTAPLLSLPSLLSLLSLRHSLPPPSSTRLPRP